VARLFLADLGRLAASWVTQKMNVMSLRGQIGTSLRIYGRHLAELLCLTSAIVFGLLYFAPPIFVHTEKVSFRGECDALREISWKRTGGLSTIEVEMGGGEASVKIKRSFHVFDGPPELAWPQIRESLLLDKCSVESVLIESKLDSGLSALLFVIAGQISMIFLSVSTKGRREGLYSVLSRQASFRFYAIGIVAVLAIWMVLSVLESESARWASYAAELRKPIAVMPNSILVAVILAPVAEELWFRGTLLRELSVKSPSVFGLCLSSALFASLHGVSSINELFVIAVAAYFTYGLVFGWIFLRSRSLWPGIFLHSANNALAFSLIKSLH
jgi:membrane protease YdiL (CAAX protease family)